MGIGLAGIARGLKQGFEGAGQAARMMEEDERKQKAAERDTERFRMEKVRFAEEEDRIKAKKDLAESLSRVSELYSSGGGIFSEGGATNAPVAANPVADAPRMGLSSVPSQDGAAPAADVPAATGLSTTPQTGAPKRENPFMTGGENKYSNPRAAQDKYYAAKSRLLQDYYNRIGEPEKALAVPKAMAELRNFEFEEKTGAALAAMASGAPGAVGAMSKVYELFDDGKKLDPNSGTFDPKTGGWTGLKVTDAEGKTSTINLSAAQIFGMAKQKDAAAIVKFNLDRGDKAFDQSMKTREVAAVESNAASNRLSAEASMVKAKSVSDEADILRRSKIDQARVTAVNDMIQNTFKPPQKLDDMTLMQARGGDKDAKRKVAEYEQQNSLYESRQGEVQTLRDRATTMLSLNPKLTASEAVAIARNGAKLPLQQDDNGTYVTYGGKKVYVN